MLIWPGGVLYWIFILILSLMHEHDHIHEDIHEYIHGHEHEHDYLHEYLIMFIMVISGKSVPHTAHQGLMRSWRAL